MYEIPQWYKDILARWQAMGVSSSTIVAATLIFGIIFYSEKIKAFYQNIVNPIIYPIYIVIIKKVKTKNSEAKKVNIEDSSSAIEQSIQMLKNTDTKSIKIKFKGQVLRVRTKLCQDITKIQLDTALKIIEGIKTINCKTKDFEYCLSSVISNQRQIARSEMYETGVPKIVIEKLNEDINPHIIRLTQQVVRHISTSGALTIDNVKAYAMEIAHTYATVLVMMNEKSFHTLNGELDGLMYNEQEIEPHILHETLYEEE